MLQKHKAPLVGVTDLRVMKKVGGQFFLVDPCDGVENFLRFCDSSSRYQPAGGFRQNPANIIVFGHKYIVT